MAVKNEKEKCLPAFDQNRKTPLAVKVTESVFFFFLQTFCISFKVTLSRVTGNGSKCLSKVAKVNIMAAIWV